MAQQNSIYAPTPFPIAKGGTGNTVALTDGQLWVGSTSTPLVPVRATLTPGTNIGITNGAGTIIVAATGPASWTFVVNNNTTVTMSPWITYSNNSPSGPVQFKLPSSATLGDKYKIVSRQQSSFNIIRNGGPAAGSIYYNNNSGGTLTTTSLTSGITLVCVLGGGSPQYSVESTNGELFILT